MQGAKLASGHTGGRPSINPLLPALHRPEEVVFTKNATEGLNIVAQAWGGQHLKPGDEASGPPDCCCGRCARNVGSISAYSNSATLLAAGTVAVTWQQGSSLPTLPTLAAQSLPSRAPRCAVNPKQSVQIISTVAEHHSALAPWQLIARHTGAVIKDVRLTPNTQELDLEVRTGAHIVLRCTVLCCAQVSCNL